MLENIPLDKYGHPRLPISEELKEQIIRLFNMGYSIDGVYHRIRSIHPSHRFMRIDDVIKLRPTGRLNLPPEFREKVYIRWQELKYTENIQEVLEYLQAEGHVMLNMDDIKHLCVKKQEWRTGDV